MYFIIKYINKSMITSYTNFIIKLHPYFKIKKNTKKQKFKNAKLDFCNLDCVKNEYLFNICTIIIYLSMYR